MKKHTIEIISVFMVVSFLSSCATIPGIGVRPQNSAEREILTQAIVVGAVAGGATGAGVGALIDKKNRGRGAAIGGLAGSVLGGLVGNEVGKRQVYNYRNIRLKNDQLTALLNSARKYNNDVAFYNSRLRRQIANIKTKTRPEQKRLAQLKKQEAERYQAQVRAAMAERAKLSETLVPEQKARYQRTLAELKKRDQQLLATIKELERISGPVRVGSRSGSMKILI